MIKSSFDKLLLSKNERLGIYFLLLIFVCFIFLPYKFSQSDDLENLESKNRTIEPFLQDSIEINLESSKISPTEPIDKSSPMNASDMLFNFDPNTLTKTTANQLGIPPHVFKRIKNYLNTGAKFKTPQQFEKIYGLTPDLYKKLLPYIQINDVKPSPPEPIVTKSKKITPIELNTCTNSDLLPLPGIGSGLSTRIIKYRDLLGGFYETSQLKEVYGISDSLYQEIRDLVFTNRQTQKLVLSEMSFSEMQKHPYIGFKIAKLISAYLKQHPQASNQEILKNLPVLGNELNKNMIHYLDCK